MQNIVMSYVSRGSDDKTASHTTTIDMTGVDIDNASVKALLEGQMKIKEQAYFAKKPAVITTEDITFAAFVARCMTKGAGTKALVDENAKLRAKEAAAQKENDELKAKIAAMEAMQK